MDQGLIPGRYAKALYKAALEQGVDSRVYTLAGNLEHAYAAEPQLAATMANPFVSTSSKTALLHTAAQLRDDDKLFADFIQLLARNRRLEYARAAAVAYRELYRRSNHIRRVSVVSAAPLSAAESTRLKELIQKHLGTDTMEYSQSVDPQLVGGFTVAVDNERLDASIASAFKQLEQKLIK